MEEHKWLVIGVAALISCLFYWSLAHDYQRAEEDRKAAERAHREEIERLESRFKQGSTEP